MNKSFTTNLKDKIDNAILEIVGANSSNSVIRKKVKDLHQGDVVVPSGCVKLDDIQKVKLLEHMKGYCSRSDTLTATVSCDKFNLLTFHMDRPKMCALIIGKAIEKGPKYGCSESQGEGTVSLNSVEDKGVLSSLVDMRLAVINDHVERLLHANGYTVCSSHQDKRRLDKFFDNLVKATPTSAPDQINDIQRLDEQLITRICDLTLQDNNTGMQNSNTDTESPISCKGSHRATESSLFTSSSNGTVSADLQNIIHKHYFHSGKGGFDSNLKSVKVLTENQPTQTLKECKRVAQSLPSYPLLSKHTCIHVVPHSAAFSNQQVALVLQSLCGSHLSQSQLTVGPVHVQGETSIPSAQEFYKKRYSQFKEASEMRNGAGDAGSGSDDIKTITVASIKMDVLRNSSNSSLTLDNSLSERGAENRLGAFVLYSTARLSTLLQCFEQAVKEGTYPPLPPVEQIQWNLLREEEDWELVFVYIESYPDIVRQSVECVSPCDGRLSAKIHIHKITNFLVTFCKCLSAHYSRYHILTGGETHLLPLMYARLYMMKAAYQVLVNSLRLIGVEPLSYL